MIPTCAGCGNVFTAKDPPAESVWTNTPDGTSVVERQYHATCWERHKVDRFTIYGWMSVYYRPLGQDSAFLDKSVYARWNALRERIMADAPQNDKGRAEAVDGVRESERGDVLVWLEQRRQDNSENSK